MNSKRKFLKERVFPLVLLVSLFLLPCKGFPQTEDPLRTRINDLVLKHRVTGIPYVEAHALGPDAVPLLLETGHHLGELLLQQRDEHFVQHRGHHGGFVLARLAQVSGQVAGIGTLADALGAAIHVEVRGENTHHMVEACFKSVGRCLREAIRRTGTDMPSTKGMLA